MFHFVTCAPVFAAGEAPVAEAGLGLIAYAEDVVELNGTGSTDPESDPLTYAWTQVGGPPVDLAGADSSKPSFTVGEAGTLRFQLVVNDGLTASSPDDVSVVVPHRAVDDVAAGCASVTAPLWLGLLLCLALRRRTRS